MVKYTSLVRDARDEFWCLCTKASSEYGANISFPEPATAGQIADWKKQVEEEIGKEQMRARLKLDVLEHCNAYLRSLLPGEEEHNGHRRRY